MSSSLYDVSVGTYLQMINSTINVLGKGAAFCQEQGVSTDTLVETKLIDDMANLHFQVVSVFHHSAGALRGIQEGEFGPPRGYADTDYAGLQAMLVDARSQVESVDASAINDLANGKVVFKMGGNELPFTTENFVLTFSLPNLFFHATTTYDLLRMKGVPLGKMDYLGQMRMG